MHYWKNLTEATIDRAITTGRIGRWLPLLALGVVAVNAQAQSKVVLGDNPDAYDCYKHAELAVVSNVADQRMIDACDRALEDTDLVRRFRVASLVNRGVLLTALGKLDLANQSYDEALRLSANQGEVFVNLGNIAFLRKNFPEAIAFYSKGIPLMDRRQHVAYLNRGLAFEHGGEFTKAQQDYEQAIALAPQWPRAQKMLARVQEKIGKL